MSLVGAELREAIESRRLYALSTFRETGTLYVSNSVLSAFAACDLRALLTGLGYVPRQTEGTAPRDAGTACHAAREVFFKTRNRGAAMLTLHTKWQEFELNNDATDAVGDDRLGFANVNDCFEEWLDRMERGYPFILEPDFVEVPFLVPLVDDPPIVLGGKIDGLARDDAGCWYVDDFKTTGQIGARWLRQFRNNSQFSAYIWAARQHTAQPVVGAIVTALELSLLPGGQPNSPKKCRVPAHGGVAYDECRRLHVKSEIIGPVLRSDAQLARWHASAVSIARRYHALASAAGDSVERMLALVEAYGAFDGGCQWCDFADACDVGITPHAIDTMLERKQVA